MGRARVAGPAGTNRDLKRRVTMLRDQTTRSKLAARQANGRDRRDLARRPIPLEGQQSGADLRQPQSWALSPILCCSRRGWWWN